MSQLTSNMYAAAVAGSVTSLLGWIDPLYIPMILLGPVITGAIAAARGISFPWIGLFWFSSGVTILVLDWMINDEDQLFHAVAAVMMVALAALGYGVVRLTTRSSARA